MNYSNKHQLFKNFFSEWGAVFDKLTHLAKLFTTFPSFQMRLEEIPIIDIQDLNESQFEWISLVAQFDNPIEKEFFKPYWVPVSKNIYEYFIDLSSDTLTVFKIIYLGSEFQRWSTEEVIPDISEFILALEDKSISFDEILYDNDGNPLDENGNPVISNSPPHYFDHHAFHASFKGYDHASIFDDNVSIHGYFLESPIEKRLIEMFNYYPVADNSKKPYQASWMISENKLLLLYVNGIINDERLFSTDIVPEYPDNDLLIFDYLNNSLTFIIEKIENPGYSVSIYNVGDILSLTFCDGILIKVEVNK